MMRRTTFGMLAVCASTLYSCGSTGGNLPTRAQPPVPVNLSVYINDSRVSVSPTTVGAGPVLFIVTNAASQTESVTVQSPSAQTLANTGPINPQATAQVTVDFRDQGDYTVATGASGSEASQATGTGIRSATIHIGALRPSGSGQLLQP